MDRDCHACVACGEKEGLTVHHLIERRLFDNGGYYLDNGVTVCGSCHILAEETNLSCDTLREKAGITKIVLPEHMYSDLEYDKWGNILLTNGTRIKGELFHDSSVQKILKQGNVLQYFNDYVKYPRTLHLPWSNPSKDDRVIKDLSVFEGKKVVVTEKMDGENFSGYKNYCHARSLEPLSGEDRGYAKAIWESCSFDLPEGWRVCAENLYAKHSIHYQNLTSYLQVFSIWDDKNVCLSWKETLEWINLLNLVSVPILYEGIWDEDLIKSLYKPEMEGYVVRLATSFFYSEFRRSVAKYVRPNHVTTSNHWRHQKLIPNLLDGR